MKKECFPEKQNTKLILQEPFCYKKTKKIFSEIIA